jgi:hypothetical protein
MELNPRVLEPRAGWGKGCIAHSPPPWSGKDSCKFSISSISRERCKENFFLFQIGQDNIKIKASKNENLVRTQ